MSYNGWEFRGDGPPTVMWFVEYWSPGSRSSLPHMWRPVTSARAARNSAAGFRSRGYSTRMWRCIMGVAEQLPQK